MDAEGILNITSSFLECLDIDWDFSVFAEFFDVTPNDLLRGLDTDVSLETLTENEIELVKNYRSLINEARKIISANVKLLTRN